MDTRTPDSVPSGSSAPSADDGSSALRIASLHAYPVKSCGTLDLEQATLASTGLALDRQWMVVDEDGEFVSQRELPRMALITPRVDGDQLVLNAPGLPPLHLPIDLPLDLERSAERVAVRVWDDGLPAFGCGRLADAWFSTALGQPLRLVRFDPSQQRLSSRTWTGDLAAPNLFSDGYPILVTSTASLTALNQRLAAAGSLAVTMARFRPNLVLAGLDRPDSLGAHAEDALHELHFDTANGPVRLRLVKPCPRCPMPNIDPLTAAIGDEPGRTLASYRADPRLRGAISFGMNAVIVQGGSDDGRGARTLRVGQAGVGSVAF